MSGGTICAPTHTGRLSSPACYHLVMARKLTTITELNPLSPWTRKVLVDTPDAPRITITRKFRWFRGGWTTTITEDDQ
jgi:hypothetical protein